MLILFIIRRNFIFIIVPVSYFTLKALKLRQFVNSNN